MPFGVRKIGNWDSNSGLLKRHSLVVIRGIILTVVGYLRMTKTGVSRRRPPAKEIITQHRDLTNSVLKKSNCLNAASP
jgi:hypothetical protein